MVTVIVVASEKIIPGIKVVFATALFLHKPGVVIGGKIASASL